MATMKKKHQKKVVVLVTSTDANGNIVVPSEAWKAYLRAFVIIAILAITGLTMRAGEPFGPDFSIDAFGGVKSDLSTERSFYGFGVQYFVTPNLGFGAYTAMENLSGKTIDNISPQIIWRVPLGKHAFSFAGGVTRTFHDETGWELNLGPLYEYALTEHFHPWVGIAFNKDWQHEEKDPYATVRVGARYTF